MAFSIRTANEYELKAPPIAPPACFAFTVMKALAAENASSGSFSKTSQEKLLAGMIASRVVWEEDRSPTANIRPRGQESHNRKMKGSVMTWGLDISPSANNIATTR